MDFNTLSESIERYAKSLEREEPIQNQPLENTIKINEKEMVLFRVERNL